MKKVVIIGVGLMGGSLGIALRNVYKNGKRQYEVFGIGRNLKNLQHAKEKDAVDNYSTDLKNVLGADIVVICTPVDTIVDTYKKISAFLGNKSIVADIGSIKFNIDNKLKSIIKQNKNYPDFIGCHPMAGIEQNGIEFASLDIYNNAKVVITSEKLTQNAKVIAKMWKDIGCKIFFMSAKEHDEIVAFTSHLPHIIAFNFYRIFKDKNKQNKKIKDIIAGSFNSITRVAKSSPEIWTPIFCNNKDNLKKLTEEFCKQIKIFVNQFDNKDDLKKILYESINNENK